MTVDLELSERFDLRVLPVSLPSNTGLNSPSRDPNHVFCVILAQR